MNDLNKVFKKKGWAVFIIKYIILHHDNLTSFDVLVILTMFRNSVTAIIFYHKKIKNK